MSPILVIIVLNIGIFLAVQISPGLVYDLGLYSPAEVFFRHPWGIVTSMFVHEEFFHLLANMITLYFFGSFLHRLVGTGRLLTVYLGGGILGSIFFILLAPPAMAIGASGAVFALGGALAVMQPNLRVFIFPIPAPMPLWVAVIGIFVILTLLPMLSTFSNIAWEAHLGGLLFGLGAGYLFRGKRR